MKRDKKKIAHIPMKVFHESRFKNKLISTHSIINLRLLDLSYYLKIGAKLESDEIVWIEEHGA
jgi:hypothetical protein